MEGEKKKLKERHGERGMGEKERAVKSRREWKGVGESRIEWEREG